MKQFQFTVFTVEGGYHVRVEDGRNEYTWPDTYVTLEQAGQQILKALKTASEGRGEI